MRMNKESKVEIFLREFLEEGYSPSSPLSDDTKLREDLGLDSLDIVELQNAIDDEFGVDATDAEIADVQTFADLANLVEDKVANLEA